MQKTRQQFIVGLAALTAIAVIPGASARQSSASAQPSSATQSASSSAAAPSAPQQDPLAAAARKAKEQQSHNAKPAKVFTNDNLPTNGGVSTVGVVPAANSTTSSADKTAGVAPAAQGEQYWRDKFATLNKKLEQDQAELDVMQRELGQLNLQNYSDPNQAMQQGYSRSDIDKKTADISAKQKEIETDKQAISDAESDLRKSGGDPGWER
jgi:hypothetical protein